MSVIEKREQQRHRDRLELGVADRRDERVNVALVERDHDLSLRIDPLGDLEAPAAGHQYGRCILEEVIEVGTRRTAQLQHVTEPASGNKPCLRPFFLDQAVGDDRRRMRPQHHPG